MGCCFSRAKQYFHPCILVGKVVHGKPVAEFNRQILALWIETGSVEDGSFASMKTGKGKVQGVEWLGRVKVGVQEQTHIVRGWAENAIRDGNHGTSYDEIFEKFKKEMFMGEKQDTDATAVELDIFKAYVVNRMEGVVFVSRKPSSFP